MSQYFFYAVQFFQAVQFKGKFTIIHRIIMGKYVKEFIHC